jgi:hypothetical protein
VGLEAGGSVFLHNKSLSDGFGLLVRARDCSANGCTDDWVGLEAGFLT